jgi:hypothetical protein
MPRVNDCVLHSGVKTNKVGMRRTIGTWRQCGGGNAGVIGEDLEEKWILGLNFFDQWGGIGLQRWVGPGPGLSLH